MTRDAEATPASPATGALEEVELVKMEIVTGGCAACGTGGAAEDPNQKPAAAAKPSAGNIINSVMGIVSSLSGLAGSGGKG